MTKTLSVAIIIVNWNGLEVTDACLESLKQMQYQNYKIVLVDNGSLDGSVSFFAEKYSQIKLIALPENTGFTGGNNTGMKWALEQGFEYVLLLNNDTIASDPHFISTMVEVMEKDDRNGMACPTIYYHNSNRIWYAGGKLSLWTGWKHYYKIPNSTQDFFETGYNTGCCLLAKSKMIHKIGLLNTAYFLSVEDVEWSMRAKQDDWNLLYIPGATVQHKDSMSSKSTGKGKYSPTRIYYDWRNSIWFIREYANAVQKYMLYPIHYGGTIIFKVAAYILLRRWVKLKAILKAVRDGCFDDSKIFKNDGR